MMPLIPMTDEDHDQDQDRDEYAFIVHEEPHGDIRCVFDNQQAAQNYGEDPEQLGNLFIIQSQLESEYEQQ